MDGRFSHHTRLLTLATLLTEALVVLHFVGVFSFLGPVLSIGLFILAGVAFQRVRRAEEAIHPPSATSPARGALLQQNFPGVALLFSVAAGLAASLLLRSY